MRLNAATVDQIRELTQADKWEMVARCNWDEITVGGALELACFELDAASSLPHRIVEIQRKCSEVGHQFPIFEDCQAALLHQGIWSVTSKSHVAPSGWEVMPAPLLSQYGDEQWSWFVLRFKRCLQANGFGNLSGGLAGAMEEMVANISEHATPTPSPQLQTPHKVNPAPGAVAFRVSQQRMSFAVADSGQGVLSSLRTNPAFSNLRTGADALHAAITDRATSKVANEYGEGFLELHQALIDLNGELRFRSDDGLLRASGLSEERHFERVENLPRVRGLQLVVHCHLQGAPPNSSFGEF